jgi:hypothetical protein
MYADDQAAEQGKNGSHPMSISVQLHAGPCLAIVTVWQFQWFTLYPTDNLPALMVLMDRHFNHNV